MPLAGTVSNLVGLVSTAQATGNSRTYTVWHGTTIAGATATGLTVTFNPGTGLTAQVSSGSFSVAQGDVIWLVATVGSGGGTSGTVCIASVKIVV
ncbi:MAG: hypothetical protein Terrestrivirus12_2 [Terrestrivirus sp.]|uniref:Uncharacterized protein n=1 Tax=Terrestrivirus sp. TaxID=2487775 RepID=A0A3G4ZTD2_9VIRU|nr:MAG: hypothetical protein Terrestrivirus12_2 [Terrestrivirus sp.]